METGQLTKATAPGLGGTADQLTWLLANSFALAIPWVELVGDLCSEMGPAGEEDMPDTILGDDFVPERSNKQSARRFEGVATSADGIAEPLGSSPT